MVKLSGEKLKEFQDFSRDEDAFLDENDDKFTTRWQYRLVAAYCMCEREHIATGRIKKVFYKELYELAHAAKCYCERFGHDYSFIEEKYGWIRKKYNLP